MMTFDRVAAFFSCLNLCVTFKKSLMRHFLCETKYEIYLFDELTVDQLAYLKNQNQVCKQFFLELSSIHYHLTHFKLEKYL